jgi:hypothetical protein
VRIWVTKYEAGSFESGVVAPYLVQLERLVGKLVMLENEFLKGLHATQPDLETRLCPSLAALWSLGRRRMPADGPPAGQPIEQARLVGRIKEIRAEWRVTAIDG